MHIDFARLPCQHQQILETEDIVVTVVMQLQPKLIMKYSPLWGY